MGKLITLLTAGAIAVFSGSSATAALCGQPGQWLDTRETARTPVGSLLDRMAGQRVVLLGEAHDSAEDHRWQLHVLAQFHSRQPNLAIGFEMFPRRLQPALDQWVAGKLTEEQFLTSAEWDKVWPFDARDYLPLFHYARMNGIPMLALNVERSLVEAVRKQGWDAVPEAQKEGVDRPVPPTPEYTAELRTIFDRHPTKAGGEDVFPRFLEAQTAWDRAMARAIAEHLDKQPKALVVGILGLGHAGHGRGVTHQLRDLGVERVGNLLTWDNDEDCANIDKGVADAVYIVRAPAGPAPRLGVATEPEENGRLKVARVVAGSVAEKAGVQPGDVILEVAGRPAKGFEMLRQLVQRQTPGTWLPIKVRRGEEEVEIVARFPVGE